MAVYVWPSPMLLFLKKICYCGMIKLCTDFCLKICNLTSFWKYKYIWYIDMNLAPPGKMGNNLTVKKIIAGLGVYYLIKHHRMIQVSASATWSTGRDIQL